MLVFSRVFMHVWVSFQLIDNKKRKQRHLHQKFLSFRFLLNLTPEHIENGRKFSEALYVKPKSSFGWNKFSFGGIENKIV